MAHLPTSLSAALLQQHYIAPAAGFKNTNFRQKQILKQLKKRQKPQDVLLDALPLSLAQKRGLLPSPKQTSSSEWESIKQRALLRLEPCAICQQHFYRPKQVLLSCSHMFHRSCIENYEKYVHGRKCPMCRCTNYEKRLTSDGYELVRLKSAIKIQKIWRGFRTRKTLVPLLESRVPNDPQLRQKYYVKKIGQCTDQLQDSVRKSKREIELLFSQMDLELNKSRQAIDQLEQQRPQELTQEWQNILSKARSRQLECPICLCGLKDQVALTSCGHLYHSQCLNSFERAGTQCPLCRQEYDKQTVYL
ncbi:hypothetical protein EDD86DRAFT_201121 [Gorgonomyces haynaldii]|nr:hypothetical protein EDD86DRAFT_201121 [Gorgonomyces haynaldii]